MIFVFDNKILKLLQKNDFQRQSFAVAFRKFLSVLDWHL